MFAGSKQIIFRLKFLCASHLKIKHFELPPAYKIEHMKQNWLRYTPDVLY